MAEPKAPEPEDSQYPELLTDLAQQVQLRLAQQKIDATEAQRIGWEVAEHIREHFAGELIYIPKGRQFQANKIHQQIWDAFTGDNVPQLVAQFKMAEPSIYRVLKFMRARSVKRNQLSLLEEA